MRRALRTMRECGVLGSSTYHYALIFKCQHARLVLVTISDISVKIGTSNVVVVITGSVGSAANKRLPNFGGKRRCHGCCRRCHGGGGCGRGRRVRQHSPHGRDASRRR